MARACTHLPVALIVLMGVGSCSAEDRGVARESLRDVYERARDCELIEASGDFPGFVDEDVEDDELKCLHDCFSRAACTELESVFCAGERVEDSRCAAECYAAKCSDGTPVPEAWLCDGFDDCADHSDETGCPVFTCSDGQVIPKSFVCSGFPDCIDESDERDCDPPAEPPSFACDDGDTILLAQYCDGIAHCSDQSDEARCAEPLCG